MVTKTEPDQTTADDDGGQADDKPETRSIDKRFAAIEAEQQKQGGMLEKILELLPGSTSSDDDDQADDDPSEPTQRHNIGAEVRRQIAEAEKRRKDEEREAGLDTWRQSVDEQLERLKPEQRPRPKLNRFQRIMYGRDD